MKSLRVILHFIRKEFLQYSRDKKLRLITLVSPIIQLFIFSYAANLSVDNIPMACFDQDQSSRSRDLISHFTASRYFSIDQMIESESEVNGLLDRGDVSMVLVIPKNFGKELYIQPSIQLLVDGTDNNTAEISLGYAKGIIGRFSESLQSEAYLRRGYESSPYQSVEQVSRIWYNPDLRSENFMVPGILVILIMVITMLLTSLAIVKEGEIGTLEQLSVTPIKPYQIIIGKITPFAVIGFIIALAALLITVYWFDVAIKGNVILLLLLCMVYILTTLGLGIFVSTITSNQQQAMLVCVFFLMLPMIFLSGFIFPISNMPEVVQYLTYCSPLTYFFVIIRGVFLKGVGLEVLWPQVVALAGVGCIILTLSVVRFKKCSS